MKISRYQFAILLALVATCTFGRLAWLAGTGAFENPAPTRFQQFGMLWTVLYWMTPALLIGFLCSRQVIYVAAAVKFAASLILLAWEYPNVVPTGAYLPDPPGLLFSMAAELVYGIPLAIALAWIAAAVSKKITVQTILLATILVPAGIFFAWAVPKYISHRAALAQWAPERAIVEATDDIRAKSMKIYLHGSFAAYAVGVKEEQRALVEKLPRAEAGVGCVIKYMDVFEAQGEYATLYNKTIVEYLQAQTQPGK